MNNIYICHSGIKGQKWGIRRFQNEDGSLTAAGKKKYGTSDNMNKVRGRNKKIAIGVGAAAAIAGAGVLGYKYHTQKKELGSLRKNVPELEEFRNKKAKNLLNLEKARDKKKYYKEHGGNILAKIKIKPGSDVAIRNITKEGISEGKAYLNTFGGTILLKKGA